MINFVCNVILSLVQNELFVLKKFVIIVMYCFVLNSVVHVVAFSNTVGYSCHINYFCLRVYVYSTEGPWSEDHIAGGR